MDYFTKFFMSFLSITTDLTKVTSNKFSTEYENCGKVDVKPKPVYGMDGNVMYNEAEVTITIRGTDNNQATRALVDNVYESVKFVPPQDYDGGFLNGMTVAEPKYLGFDEKLRHVFSLTGKATYTRS